MAHNDIDKSFISPIDTFLHKFDQTHDKSASQVQEIDKYKRINNLRDKVQADKDSIEIWADF
ncbi:MAG: hypothetical protein CMF38_03065 [Legionellaceae bacterium]|nr:hypothetical protein [Legionellaceae bacterium]HCA90276.1 hypothetical protein [Legionellales bacterium]|tara:strand:- start:980 stop:1165 length:186 start_codon:yes stop_codon:yes gene_type:complete